MGRESEHKKFQPRMLASYSKPQLLDVFLWSEKNVVGVTSNFTQDFFKAVETVEFDEKGKKMDEKGRNRLRLAIKAIGTIVNDGYDIGQIEGLVAVWQETPDKDGVGVRWNTVGHRRNFGQKRY